MYSFIKKSTYLFIYLEKTPMMCVYNDDSSEIISIVTNFLLKLIKLNPKSNKNKSAYISFDFNFSQQINNIFEYFKS